MDWPVIIRSDGAKLRGTMARAGPDFTLRLDPGELTYLRVDWQTRLQFDKTEVVIGSPFTLHRGGVDYHLNPEAQGELGPVMGLYPDTLASATTETRRDPSTEIRERRDSGGSVQCPV